MANPASQEVFILDHPEVEPVRTPLSEELVTEWTRNKPSLGRSHFLRHLLTSGVLADVTFSVNGEDGGIEKIKAHKSILKVKSDFFAALFSNRWSNDQVDLTKLDITNLDFKTFLQYLYLKEVTLTKENVVALYDITHMYNVADLKQLCENYLEANFDEENALNLFKTVFIRTPMMSGNKLLNTLAECICRNGESMLEKKEMMDFSSCQLSAIFTHAIFNSTPIKILRFCLKWTERKFGKKKLEEFEELDRYFRFELNLSKYFDLQLPRLSDLRIPAEKIVLIVNSTSPPMPVMPVHDSNTVYAIQRFGEKNAEKRWKYRRNHADRISFRCTESIILTGVGLYGDREFGPADNANKRSRVDKDVALPSKYDVDIRVYNHGKGFKELLYAFRRGGQHMNLLSCIYKVTFKDLYLYADEWYTVSVRINGPPSYSGELGVPHKIMRCGNIPVLFEFQEASSKDEEAKLSNATGVPMGQIPKLFFKLVTDSDDDIKVL